MQLVYAILTFAALVYIAMGVYWINLYYQWSKPLRKDNKKGQKREPRRIHRKGDRRQ